MISTGGVPVKNSFSAGPDLDYFYMIHRGGRKIGRSRLAPTALRRQDLGPPLKNDPKMTKNLGFRNLVKMNPRGKPWFGHGLNVHTLTSKECCGGCYRMANSERKGHACVQTLTQ